MTSVQRDTIIVAALRYSAVADWFEKYTGSTSDEMRAMDIFNVVESELRSACASVLRVQGFRNTIMREIGVKSDNLRY